MSNIISDNTLNLDRYSTIEYLNMLASDDSNDGIVDDSDHIRLTINNRTIEPINEEDILVEKDSYSRTIIFCMNRMRGGVDMFEKNIMIHYENANGEGDADPVTTKRISDKDDTVIEFVWTVSDKACYYPGKVQFSVEFFDNDGYRWFTKPTVMEVEEGLNADKYIKNITENWYLLWRDEAYKIVNQINDVDGELIKSIGDAETTTGLLKIENTEAESNLHELKSIKNSLDGTNGLIETANIAKNNLSEEISKADENYNKLFEQNTNAEENYGKLENENIKAAQYLESISDVSESLDEQNSRAERNISNLESINGNAEKNIEVLGEANTLAETYINELKELPSSHVFASETSHKTTDDVNFGDSSPYMFLTACFRPFKDEVNAYTVTWLRDYPYKGTFISEDGSKKMEVIIETSEIEPNMTNIYFNCDTEEEYYIEYIVGSIKKMI